jgi:hypothetical protein
MPSSQPQTDFRISETDFDQDTFTKAKSVDDYLPPAPDQGGEGSDGMPEPEEDPQPGFGGGTLEGMGAGTAGMSQDEALEETRKLMDMRQTAQSLAISFVADGTVSGYEKYNYKDWQFNLLVKAWAPIIQAKNLKVNPAIQILYAEGISTGPLFVLMFKNRKIRMENEDLRLQVQRLNREKMELQQAAAEGMPGNTMTAPKNVQIRKDIKTLWLVDDNGRFKYSTGKDAKTHNYRYIPDAERTDKPMLTKDNYTRLCKYNGQNKIDLIFKTGATHAG